MKEYSFENGAYIVDSDSLKNYDPMYDFINDFGLSGIDVLNIFTNYHGMQLLTSDFLHDLFQCEYELMQDNDV